MYSRWAKTGAAILMTGNVMIDRRYKENPRNVVVDDEKDLDILIRWAAESQVDGCSLWAQISHPGRQSPRSVTSQPVAPSDVAAVNPGVPAFAKPRALTKDEIQDIIHRFANTSKIVQKAGFQGVQIHGTNSPRVLCQHLYSCTRLFTKSIPQLQYKHKNRRIWWLRRKSPKNTF